MRLQGERIYMLKLQVADAQEVLDYELRNRALFEKVEPTGLSNRQTMEKIVETLERLQIEWEQDRTYAFGIFASETDELIGRLALRMVVRSIVHQGQLGYSVDQAWHGKGIGTEAVQLALRFAFEELKLHRIEAGVMPRNIGSNRILEKCGFTKEGLNRKNLHIFGQWEDHYLWAILDSDWQPERTNSVEISLGE